MKILDIPQSGNRGLNVSLAGLGWGKFSREEAKKTQRGPFRGEGGGDTRGRVTGRP